MDLENKTTNGRYKHVKNWLVHSRLPTEESFTLLHHPRPCTTLISQSIAHQLRITTDYYSQVVLLLICLNALIISVGPA